jgi:hypothetical protein
MLPVLICASWFRLATMKGLMRIHLPRSVLLSGFGSIRLRFVCFRRCIGHSSISKDPHISIRHSAHAASASGRAARRQTSSGSRTACFVTTYMLHLRQDVYQAARRCQGHANHDLSLRPCCICVRTCAEQPDVVNDAFSMLCLSIHAASASGRAPSGQTLSKARTASFTTPITSSSIQNVMCAPSGQTLSGTSIVSS